MNEGGKMFLEKFTESVFAIVGILLIFLIVFFFTMLGLFTYYKLNNCKCVIEREGVVMDGKLKFNLKTNSIVCGDCEEWLKFIPNNSIDLIYICLLYTSPSPRD